MNIKKEPSKCGARKSEKCTIEITEGMPYFIQSIKGTKSGTAMCIHCLQASMVEGYTMGAVKQIVSGRSLSDVIGDIFGGNKQ